jgi:glyoxylase-like metal-dependent hydrolase (beta-lactamase superfamily II)
MLEPLSWELLEVGSCRQWECMAMRGGRMRVVRFPALCALIRHPTRGTWLYDTGYSSHFFDATQPFPERLYRWLTPVRLPEEDRLLRQLDQRGVHARDIDGIIVSHFHADHIAGLRDFPNASFLASRAGYSQARTLTRTAALRRAILPRLLPDHFSERTAFVEDLAEAVLPAALHPFLLGRDLFGDGSLMAVSLPGHAEGQFGLLLQGAQDQLAFLVADACWSLAGLQNNRPPSRWAQAICHDPNSYLDTFARLRELTILAPQIVVVPSHCEDTAQGIAHAG